MLRSLNRRLAVIAIASAFSFCSAYAASSNNCLVAGDSIAVGIGNAFSSSAMVCDVSAKVGVSTEQIRRNLPKSGHYKTVILSAGSNDDPPSEASFKSLRDGVSGKVVIWILPYTPDSARIIVHGIARERGDLLLDLSHYPTKDGIHPAGSSYRDIARAIYRAAPN